MSVARRGTEVGDATGALAVHDSTAAAIVVSLDTGGPELDDELSDHLERKTEEYVAKGMAAEEARRQARLDLGGVEKVKEECRDARRVNLIQDLVQDIRFGLRTLRKSPGFTAIAVLTLALGIGANTMIFSAVYALLLKPLPFKGSDRLVFIVKKNPPRGWTRNPISPAEILAWRNQSGAFEDIAAYTQRTCVLTGGGEAEEDPCEIISSNIFPLLNLPIRGRPFSAEEDKPQGPRVAILSYGLWQRRFAGDENVIGRAFDVNGDSYTIVGVMPSNFSHLYASPYGAVPELWLSGIGLSPTLVWNDFFFGIGRLKPGISLRQAEARMNIVSERIGPMHNDLKGWRAQLMTLRTNASGNTRPALLVLMGAVPFG